MCRFKMNNKNKRTKDYSGKLKLMNDAKIQRFKTKLSVPEESGLMETIQMLLNDLLTSEDARLQLDLVKAISSKMKMIVKGGEDRLESLRDAVDVFVNIYLSVESQHPIKRVIASCLQSMPQCLHGFTQEEMCRSLRVYVIELSARDGNLSEINVSKLRHNVNIITALLDNFPIGELCIQELFSEVITFLAAALEIFLEAYRPTLPPIECNAIMTHSHVTLQTTNKILQKCTSAANCCHGDISGLARHILNSCKTILMQDKFLLDTQRVVGINLALFFNILGKSEKIHQIMHCIFPKIKTDSNISTPDWLISSGLTGLSDLDLSLTSHLCLCQGLLAVMDGEDLLSEFTPGKCLLTDVILEEFLSANNRHLDTGPKLLVAKSLVLWTSRAISVLESSDKGSNLAARFLGPGPVVQKLLNYVWSTWEDPVDAIKANSRQIFDKAVTLHHIASQTGEDDPFLHSLATRLLLLNWSVKVKYGLLVCLVDHIGANQMLMLYPHLPQSILGAFQEHTLACHAHELFEKLCCVHVKEVEDLAGNEGLWEKTWIDPVLSVLCCDNKAQKMNILEYVLPRLLKVKKDVLHIMIERLSSMNSGTANSKNLGALVMCMRRARTLGQLRHGTQVSCNEAPHKLFGIIEPGLLRQALSSQDEQVRLDAFALLCENKKTSEPIDVYEFELIKFFLHLNMNNQSPSFRQMLLSFVKKFLTRFAESGAVLMRAKIRPRPASTSSSDLTDIKYYKEFSQWLVIHLLNCLFPGGGFARTTTALSALSLIMDLLKDNSLSSVFSKWLSLTEIITTHHVRSLVECLTDKFEDNKIQAFKILCHLSDAVPTGKLPCDWLKVMFESALRLSVSPKPQDCTTAAYLFRLVIRYDTTLTWITAEIQNKYSVTSEHSSQLTEHKTVYHLVKLLLESLREQVATASHHLLRAASTGPLYPVINCIRYLLTDCQLSCMKTDKHWQCLIAELIQCCCEAASVVSPVVQNSSPEGNIPLEAIKGGSSSGLGLDSLSVSSEDGTDVCELGLTEGKVSLMPEYLVVCCWRTTKEVSLLLGQVAVQAPVRDPRDETSPGLLSYNQILTIGNYFINQLLESKHRGAFEMAYAGFVTMMEMLWRNPHDEIRELPEKWLSQVMEDIQSEDGKSKLCATRRSAGVPFFVQAVLATEPDLTGRSKFRVTMAQLLEFALQTKADVPPNSDAQVHALNILRSLYRDSHLSKDVSMFVADGMKAAVQGFSASDWAVRNSSTLLFSALMTRIFGVKRSKDHSGNLRKNCLTGRNFFQRFPTLYQFLLTQLQDATSHIGVSGRLQLHPGLYPILMILGRLVPSVMEGGDTSLNMAAFIPHIIRCASSPVLKIRLMAARALQPLVYKDQVMSVLIDMTDKLPTHPGAVPHSHVHGILLQIKEVLHCQQHFPAVIRENIAVELPRRLLKRAWLCTSVNSCVLTRKEMMEVVTSVLKFSSPGTNCDTDELRKCLCNVLDSEAGKFSCYNPHTPGLTEYLVTVTNMCLDNVLVSREDDGNVLVPLEEKGNVLVSHVEESNVLVSHVEEGNVLASPSNRDDSSALIQQSENPLKDEKSSKEKTGKLYTLLTDNESSSQATLEDNFNNILSSSVSVPVHGPASQEKLCSRLSSFLLSEFYEVRLATLKKLEMFHETFQTKTSGSSAQSDLPGETSDFQRFEPVYTHLVDMVFGDEKWEPCLARVFQVLRSCPFLPELTEKGMYNTTQVFSRVLQVIQHTKSDELKCSAVLFNSCIFSLLYQRAVTQPVSEVFTWIEILQEFSSPTQSDEVNVTVAQVIVSNAEDLLTDPLAVLGPVSLRVWDVVIQLLQDEDKDVRDMMTTVLPAIDHSVAEAVHPVLTTDRLLEKLVASPLSSHTADWFNLLIDLMIRESLDINADKEGVFDRGEMNTYSEEVTLTVMVSRHLKNVLSLEQPSTDTVCHGDSERSYFDDPVHEFFRETQNINEDTKRNPQASREMLIPLVDQAMRDICEKLDTVLTEFGDQCGLLDVFVRTNQYEWSVSLIARLLVTLKCLTSGLSSSQTGLYTELSEKLDQIFTSNGYNNLLIGIIS